MGAPVAMKRQVPAGEFLRNGYQALVTFAANPTIELWEKVVTPPGYSMGEKIDTTTQHNKKVRTAAAPVLAEVKDSKFTAAYDPIVTNEFQRARLLGVETTITKTFPNGDTLAFYGYWADFEPDGMEHAKFPEATITIKVTNCDPTQPRSGIRQAPRPLRPVVVGPDGKPLPGQVQHFPEHLVLGAGTGTAYLANEWPPVWTSGP